MKNGGTFPPGCRCRGHPLLQRRNRVHTTLETGRLLLRRLTEADADNLTDLDSDPAVMRYLTGGAATPREWIAREILPRFLRSYARDGYGVFAVIEKTTGDFLGWISLRPAEEGEADEAELGYRLHASAWGKGYATEGAWALIRRGFTEHGLRRVLATTYEHNRTSRRVMEKLGMTLVRSYRMTPDELAAQDTFDGASQELWDGDDVEYALDRDAWERQ
jgi:RimJ/RimL family protein N-acetyltransferase